MGMMTDPKIVSMVAAAMRGRLPTDGPHTMEKASA